jgi:hypothetical protein
MPLPSHTPHLHPQGPVAPHRAGAGRSAEALLGTGHPLVAVLYACAGTAEGIAAVAAVQLGALALWWVNASYGRALTLGAGVVQVALGLRWASLRVQRREQCLELVIAGREQLPLAAVARECRRLGSPRRQTDLATCLENLADSATRKPCRGERQRPICSRRVLTAAEPELRGVVARLRAGGGELRGVAMLDRLLTFGASPLYGERVGPLREELARGGYLLTPYSKRGENNMADIERDYYKEYEGAGERDMLIGFSVVGFMILAALITTLLA